MRASGVLPRLCASRRRHQHHRRGAVVDARGVGGGHRAVLVEGRAQLPTMSSVMPCLGYSSASTTMSPLRGLDRDRRDLVLEPAGLHRRLGLVLRCTANSSCCWRVICHCLRDVLRGGAHVIAVEGVPQAVLDHGVDQFDVAHLHAAAQMLAVRRHAHGLLAARHHDLAVAIEDGLIAERHGAQAGAAELVHPPGRALDRNAGGDGGLPRRVLALAGGEDLPEDDLGDLAALDAGALERLGDGDLPEFVRRQGGKRPVERADGRAGSADDDDIVLHWFTPSCPAWLATGLAVESGVPTTPGRWSPNPSLTDGAPGMPCQSDPMAKQPCGNHAGNWWPDKTVACLREIGLCFAETGAG